MRDIKFKVWDKVNKRMIEWEELILLPIWEVFTINTEEDTMEILEFSGMTDKLGNELYEGDIIEYQNEKYRIDYMEGEKSWKILGITTHEDTTSYDMEIVSKNSLLLENSYRNPTFLDNCLDEFAHKTAEKIRNGLLTLDEVTRKTK